MLFHSLQFAIFFPIVIILYFTLPPKIRNYWLLIASYIFYMGWNPIYALLLLDCTIFTYLISLAISAINDDKNSYIFRRLLITVDKQVIYKKIYENNSTDILLNEKLYARLSINNNKLNIEFINNNINNNINKQYIKQNNANITVFIVNNDSNNVLSPKNFIEKNDIYKLVK